MSNEDKNEIIADLKEGVSSPFWEHLVKSIDQTIQSIEDEIRSDETNDGVAVIDLPSEKYKMRLELLKARKADLESIKKLPENLVAFLSGEENEEEDFDPYD